MNLNLPYLAIRQFLHKQLVTIQSCYQLCLFWFCGVFTKVLAVFDVERNFYVKTMEMMEENSSVSEIMTYFNIFLLSWEDIWLVEILPKLNLEDLFRFRGTCKQAYELVNIYFSRLKKIDLTDKRSFNIEHYKVCKFCNFFLKSFLRQVFF